MKLFEARNGKVGFSYVRCYIWASDEGAAGIMAKHAFEESKLDRSDNIKVKELFDESAAPFATLPDDGGWDTGRAKKRLEIPR